MKRSNKKVKTVKTVKTVKCYVLSVVHGTCQIGHIVFQPCTGASFHVDSMKDCIKENCVEIENGGKDMDTALKALKMFNNF